MSLRRMKLVLRNVGITATPFEIVKTTNTLAHGVPGDKLSRATVDTILAGADIRRGDLTIEFLDKS